MFHPLSELVWPSLHSHHSTETVLAKGQWPSSWQSQWSKELGLNLSVLQYQISLLLWNHSFLDLRWRLYFLCPLFPCRNHQWMHPSLCFPSVGSHTSIFLIPTFTISCQPMFSTSMSYTYLKVNISKQNWYPLILILTSVLPLHYTPSFTPSSGLGILLDISHFYTLIQSLGSVNYHS